MSANGTEASPMNPTYRAEVRAEDVQAVSRLAAATDFFNAAEVGVAAELVSERLGKGEGSGYAFLFAEEEGALLGYACYGAIPGTQASYDLYWIVVHPRCQGQGLGRALIERTEALILRAGGHRVYIETSARPQYAATRAFYERCGYRREALLEDFYAPGDGKLIYCKTL